MLRPSVLSEGRVCARNWALRLLLVALCVWGGVRAMAQPAPPANDMFTNATVLPSTVSGTLAGDNNPGATKENNEPNHGGNMGGEWVWYLWVCPPIIWRSSIPRAATLTPCWEFTPITAPIVLTPILLDFTTPDHRGRMTTWAAGT